VNVAGRHGRNVGLWRERKLVDKVKTVKKACWKTEMEGDFGVY